MSGWIWFFGAWLAVDVVFIAGWSRFHKSMQTSHWLHDKRITRLEKWNP